MRKSSFSILALALAAAQALGHDPRTVARDFSHAMSIEGAGTLTISYKSLHWNEPAFNNRKNERTLTALNRLWKTIGKLSSEFDIVIGSVQVPKGSYNLGFSFDASDNYKLVLADGNREITIPLQVVMDSPVVNYLTLDLRPEDDTDTFVFEARYGKLRAWAEVKVPYLAPHEHKQEKKS
jgi:hypothetical protein